MSFSLDKKNILSRTDKSQKGEIDKPIQDLITTINANPNYVTTSSCSGRIVLLATNNSFSKTETSWLYVSHDPVTTDLSTHLPAKPTNDVWFRYEGAILHLKCKTKQAAEHFIALARSCGFKRTGALSLNLPIAIELTSSEYLNIPLAHDGKILCTPDNLHTITTLANDALKRNKKKLDALELLLRGNHKKTTIRSGLNK